MSEYFFNDFETMFDRIFMYLCSEVRNLGASKYETCIPELRTLNFHHYFTLVLNFT